MSGEEAATSDAIDRCCEELQEDASGQRVDFHVERSIRRLVHLGLIVADGPGWRALPLNAATTKLDATWDNWFNG